MPSALESSATPLPSRWATALRLLLILLWLPSIQVLLPLTSVVLFSDPLESASNAIDDTPLVAWLRRPDVTRFDPQETRLLAGLLAGPALVFVLAWAAPQAMVHPGRIRFAEFVRLVWRAYLGGYVLVPAIAVFARYARAALPISSPPGSLELLLPAGYLVAAPAVVVWARKRGLRKRWSWRPVCPECGYDIRRAAEPRCPECGTPFPTAAQTYRRWAVRRLAWDRRVRGGVVLAYLRTMVVLVLRPCAAARQLALPDRYGRAIRFALGHVVLAALVVAVVQALPAIVTAWLAWDLSVRQPGARMAPWMPSLYGAWNSGVTRAAAWLVALGVLPALGVLLAWALPGRHAAARLAGMKWSLYAIAPVVLIVLLDAARDIAFYMERPYTPYFGHDSLGRVALAGAVMAYSVYWGIGLAQHPYQRSGFPVAMGFSLLYVVAVSVFKLWVAPPWVLSDLL